MTSELINQVAAGVIPNDDDLKHAAHWFNETADRIRLLGERFYFAHDDVRQSADRLNGYLSVREMV